MFKRLFGFMKYRFILGLLAVLLPVLAVNGNPFVGKVPSGEVGRMHANPDCQKNSRDGRMPVVANSMKRNTIVICYDEMTVLHSGISRTPLWVAERLTDSEVKDGGGFGREDFKFYPDGNLPMSDRAELSDYARSGYDRGHMAPSRDFGSKDARAASFSLANIVPQDPQSNRGVWADIESTVRDMAKKDGELFVVTGTLFLGDKVKRIKGRVLVPTHVWKAVFNPVTGSGGVYLVENIPVYAWKILAIDQFEALSGVSPFPGLLQRQRMAKAKLPSPAKRK